MAQETDAPTAAAVPAEKRAVPAAKSRDGDLGKEKGRQRARAVAVIAKYAGDNAREAQKTKWIVDLVMKVEGEYSGALAQQQATVADLQQQIAELSTTRDQERAEAQQQLAQQQQQIHELEVAQYNSQYACQAALADHATMEAALQHAEAGAAAATQECAQLAAAIRAMFEQDARARRGLAHRSHKLRVALLDTAGQLREVKTRDRAARREEELKLRHREQALLAERRLLQEQQAANAARDAELELLQLKFHAAAQQLSKIQQQADAVPAAPADSGCPVSAASARRASASA